MSLLDRAKDALGSLTEETIAFGQMDKDKSKRKSPKPKPKPEPKVKPKAKKPKKQVVETKPAEVKDDPDNAFGGHDESEAFFDHVEKGYETHMAAYGDTPIPEVKDGAIEDILALLKIPVSFEIERDIFMPEDIDEVSFHLEVPKGYERAEVDSFKEHAKRSIEHFIKLLKERNKHVAHLATTVDRLQVDLNNLKFQAEMADGISIIPSGGEEDLENENSELRVQVANLKAQLAAARDANDGKPLNVSPVSGLRDRISELESELSELHDENESLRNKIAMYLENSDSADFDDLLAEEERFLFGEKENSGENLDVAGLAAIGDEDKAYEGSAFGKPDESLSDFVSNSREAFAGDMDGDDDEDDDLTALMNSM